ncbi:MAG TPA: SIS domain-containing protein [Solirubrobacterales bacterium]|nr:SIS domain-containing protein [Solirubrobacterales bacterium]
MRQEALDIPEHLRDALWKVEAAKLQPQPAAGLAVCGMGGSAIGGDLAIAALGPRLTAPMVTLRGYSLPAWVTPEWAVLCSSFSGDTEETLACCEAAGELGARRLYATTGGRLGELARTAGEPVIGLPGILPAPRTAVAYTLVAALAAAAAAEVAPGLSAEIEAAAAELAASIGDRTPVILGADLTAPVAARWKSQINENAKRHAFHAEIPEACHNEAVPWGTDGASNDFHAVLLTDPDQHPRERRRMEILAEIILEAGGGADLVEGGGGASRTARLITAVMLGDLVSLDLAERAGTDPAPIAPIDRLKRELG